MMLTEDNLNKTLGFSPTLLLITISILGNNINKKRFEADLTATQGLILRRTKAYRLAIGKSRENNLSNANKSRCVARSARFRCFCINNINVNKWCVIELLSLT